MTDSKGSSSSTTTTTTTNLNTHMVHGVKETPLNRDIWVHGIFPFVGMGQFAFLAHVNHNMKDMYVSYCATVESPPWVQPLESENPEYRPATASDTFFREGVSSNFWVQCEILKNHHAKGISVYEKIYKNLIESGNLEALVFIHKNGCPWDTKTCQWAARNGHLEMLKYAHENGCPWDNKTCHEAAASGHLEVLKYARDNGCPWDESTSSFAAKNGHLEVMKYACENGCPWHEITYYAPIYGFLEVSNSANKRHAWNKFICGARDAVYEWNKDTCLDVARNGHLQVLKFLHENGCPWDEETCSAAAFNGHLEVSKYAYENGCPWKRNEWTCSKAAESGNLDVLKYFRENGCPWDHETCSAAASTGHLEVLKYAHENGCPWNEKTYFLASVRRRLGVLMYLHENGCPCYE